jgi:hypothetical protein
MRPQDFSNEIFNLINLIKIFLAATPIDSKRRAETWKKNRRALVRIFICFYWLYIDLFSRLIQLLVHQIILHQKFLNNVVITMLVSYFLFKSKNKFLII